jgi:hypothetical protein
MPTEKVVISQCDAHDQRAGDTTPSIKNSTIAASNETTVNSA